MATILNSDIKPKSNIADFVQSVACFNQCKLTSDNVLDACETYFFARTTDSDISNDWWLVQFEQVKHLMGEHSIEKMTIDTSSFFTSPWGGAYSPERYILIMALVNLQTDEFYIDPLEASEELEEWLRLAYLLGEIPTVYHDMQIFFPWFVDGTNDKRSFQDMKAIYDLIDVLFPKEHTQLA